MANVKRTTHTGRNAILEVMLELMGEGSIEQHQLDLGGMVDAFDDGSREPVLHVDEHENGNITLEIEVARYKIIAF